MSKGESWYQTLKRLNKGARVSRDCMKFLDMPSYFQRNVLDMTLNDICVTSELKLRRMELMSENMHKLKDQLGLNSFDELIKGFKIRFKKMFKKVQS